MGTFLIISTILILLLILLYLFAVCPNHGRKELFGPFEERYIAHRGLHVNPSVPENSLDAFSRAVQTGYAIELDVQLTSDDQLVVFHDETLKRVCGDDRKLHELTFSELSTMRLFGTGERIPLFREVLDMIAGRVPLVVEIKSEGRYIRTTELTCEMLKSYDGLYCVESFHPMVLRHLRNHYSEFLRGQLSTDYRREEVDVAGWQRFILTNLMMNWLSRPDFIAYDHRYKERLSFRICRSVFKPVCFAWTVQSQSALEDSKKLFDAVIFDSFIPQDDHTDDPVMR